MTLSKLARLANVSVSVVSKAFSGREDISDAMRAHVFAVAREHGCFEQFYHVPYDKPVVAVIIPEAISQYYIHYIEVLKKSLEQSGYTMLLSISNFDRQRASELVSYYTVHSKVDALILLTSVDTMPQNISTAVISIGNDTNHAGAQICSDLNGGLAEALQYLKENGHRHIAFVSEPLTDTQCKIMKEEMRRAELEIRDEWFITSSLRFEAAGADGVRRIWAAKEKPTAILGAYGYITQGILKELGTMGLRVPQDVSVIAVNDDPSPLDPALDVSCLQSGIETHCEIAMQLLRERIRSESPNEPTEILLKPHFHKGNTIMKR